MIELVDVPSLARLYRFHTRGAGRASTAVAARPDFVAAVAALFGVLIFDTLPGLFIGIGVSILLLVYRASRPHIAVLARDPGSKDRWNDIARHPDNERVPGIVVLRCESALFFANADAVREAIRASIDEHVHAVVLDAETVPAIDVTAVSMLPELGRRASTRTESSSPSRAMSGRRPRARAARNGRSATARYPTVSAAVDALTQRH